jgi:hypothetical protein
MKLQTATFSFEFLTDCFSGTAEGKNATHSELRVPPIRGHVRMWHVAAFGIASCNEIWGSTAGDGAGSRVAMKLTKQPGKTTGEKSELLPHELKKSSLRHALPAGSRATLELTRLPLCANDQWVRAQRAVKLWLLLGTLGLRSARAAGSVWPIDNVTEPWVPKDEAALRKELSNLGYSKIVQFADASILDHSMIKREHSDAAKLRCAASDTVNGSPQYFGDIKPARKPSPLKMKVIRLGTDYRLLLTGLASTVDFNGAHRALGTGKPLGSVQWL